MHDIQRAKTGAESSTRVLRRMFDQARLEVGLDQVGRTTSGIICVKHTEALSLVLGSSKSCLIQARFEVSLERHRLGSTS